jgi:hypothetical protein
MQPLRQGAGNLWLEDRHEPCIEDAVRVRELLIDDGGDAGRIGVQDDRARLRPEDLLINGPFEDIVELGERLHQPNADPTERHGSAHDMSADLRPPPRPRWVVWLVIAIAVAVLVFLGAHLLFMGGGRGIQHMPGMNHGMSASVIQGGLGGDGA